MGPPWSAGRSILMYGPPGNGKSSISNGIRDAMGDKIYVPRAIEYSGQVITVYDPIVHSKAEVEVDDPNSLRRTRTFDTRYVRCERPTVITGGELSLDMLDLVYNPTARTYQAPLQLKSTGGIFIVDDLGRQAEPPQALVNRWIVPLEESKDILALQSGEKFEVPFDTLVIFSTNFHPNEIFDKAALRRIFFKIKIDGPCQEDFLKIFAMVARKRQMPLDEAALVHLLQEEIPHHRQYLCELSADLPDRPDDLDLRIRGHSLSDDARADRPRLGEHVRQGRGNRALTPVRACPPEGGRPGNRSVAPVRHDVKAGRLRWLFEKFGKGAPELGHLRGIGVRGRLAARRSRQHSRYHRHS